MESPALATVRRALVVVRVGRDPDLAVFRVVALRERSIFFFRGGVSWLVFSLVDRLVDGAVRGCVVGVGEGQGTKRSRWIARSRSNGVRDKAIRKAGK